MKLKTYTIRKGKHDYWPPSFPRPFFKSFELEFQIVFGNDCDYNQGRGDAWDQSWHKIGGFSDQWFVNNHNAALIGYRHNLETDLMQLAPFFNVNKGIIVGQPDTWVSIPRYSDPVKVLVKKHYRQKAYEINLYDPNRKIWTGTKVTAHRKSWRAKLLSAWHGGAAGSDDRPAPQTMTVFISCKKIN